MGIGVPKMRKRTMMGCFRRTRGVLGLAVGLWAFGSVGFGPVRAEAAIPAAERQALVDLYNATGGADWWHNTGWLGAAGTECNWYGVTCDAGKTTVVQLVLWDNHLNGTLPESLSHLKGLTGLYLYYNELTGSLPAGLGELSNLRELHLHSNGLKGTIPPAIGALSKLEVLDLHANQLTGVIPEELGGLSALIELDLGGNELTGTIPAELGQLPALQSMDLNSNGLSGAIPVELGGLAGLLELDLSGNELSGPIPTEIVGLSKLRRLILAGNDLSGEIPGVMGRLTALTEMLLRNNHLTGPIPSQLGVLGALRLLDLGANELTGSIPPELGGLAGLEWLELDSNRLQGRIPPELGRLARLERLQLQGNRLTGRIPSDLLQLTKLQLQGADFRYNGLWTDDADLAMFLDSVQDGGDWRGTQTVAPSGVTAVATSETSVTVSWTPIAYTRDAGGYLVSYAPAAGGPATHLDRTADKSVSSLEITGLTPGDYFVFVETETDAHDYQKNIVRSEPGPRVWVTTNGGTPPPPTRQVISLIANLDGKHGSHWVSDLKVTNPYGWPMTVVFQGTPHDTSASGTDPVLTRTIDPGATLGIEDVYSALFGSGAQGKARLLITASDGQGMGMGAPVVTSNIYNAAPGGGEFQTYGMPVGAEDLAQAGTVLGDNTVKGVGERYNFDVTTGEAGATIRYTYRDSMGGDERTATVSYRASSIRQHVEAQKLFGLSALAPDSSIIAEVQAGSAFLRGTPTNNVTSDSRSQPWQVVVDPFQKAVAGKAPALVGNTPVGQVISLIANLDGKHGSHWMSDVKITNPFTKTLQVVLKGTPHDTSGSGADPRITRQLRPGETLGIEDVYGAIFGGQAQGKARLVIVATGSGGGIYALPIVTSNIYNVAEGGGEFQTYGPPVATNRLYPAGTVLGDNTVKGAGERYNFDVVAGPSGATILYTYRDSGGGDVRTATVSYKASATRQHVDAQKLFGLSELAANSSIVAEIQAGSGGGRWGVREERRGARRKKKQDLPDVAIEGAITSWSLSASSRG